MFLQDYRKYLLKDILHLMKCDCCVALKGQFRLWNMYQIGGLNTVLSNPLAKGAKTLRSCLSLVGDSPHGVAYGTM